MKRDVKLKSDDLAERVKAVRRFNRFYTRQIGVLNEPWLESRFSLTEGRVIYELANRQNTTATELGNELSLDAGYLSRTLRGFEKQGLIKKRPAEKDARQSVLSLTTQGQKEFRNLDQLSQNQIENLLSNLSAVEQNRLVTAMKTIEELLRAKSAEESFSYILRPPQPGDLGWVVQSNGAFYAQEYGWDESYEALVAQIVADFVKNYDSKRERCWIAEKDGENVGSVFLVKKSETVAKLRLLIVDPKARGLGIGKRLVDECTRFARQVGYRKITLWTNSILLAARSIYKQAGYELVKSEDQHLFGVDSVGETWELKL